MLAFTDQQAAEQAVAMLSGNEHILYAELDTEIQACDTAQMDVMDFNSYGAASLGFSPLLSWARRCGGSARVAIIDSGVSRHPLLSARLICGSDYVDNDDDPTNDLAGHGTHVAGIVADCTTGAPVSLYAVRVLNDKGKGLASNAANGVLEAVETGIPIINLSFVGTTQSYALDDAVLNALESGCTVVMAAGNNGLDTAGVWPSHLTEEGVIVVGAADADGARASYTNYGESVDFYVPGTGIRSCSNGGGYETRSGTSQAAPHISAACALLSIVHPGQSPGALERSLKGVSDGPTGRTPRLDALVPQLLPFHLADGLTLGTGETLKLPTLAMPLSCEAQITWTSSAPDIAAVSADGTLTALRLGTAVLTAHCGNFSETEIPVEVTDSASGRLDLPAALSELSEAALLNTDAEYVIFPDLLQNIGQDAIDPTQVILCSPDSPLLDLLEERQLNYIAAEQSP